MLHIQPMKTEQIECSETLAYNNQTPGKYPKEYIHNTDVSTCVAVSYILHYIGLNGIFSLEYCGVKPKTEAASTSQAPSIHLYWFWTHLFTRPDPFCCLGWTCSTTHICQRTWLWMASGMHISEATCRPHCRMGLCSISRDFLVWTKLGDLYFHCWVHTSLHIPTWGSASIITWRRGTTNRTSITAVGVIFTVPLQPGRLLSVADWALSCRHYLTLGHQTVELLVNMGLITMVYIQCTILGFRTQVLPNVLYRSEKPCTLLSSHLSAVPSMSIPCPEKVQGIWPRNSAAMCP